MTNRFAFLRCHGVARAALLLILTGSALFPASARAQAILANEVIDPRTFGYVVGDKIRREVHLTLHSDYRLDQESLPKAGRLDRWLELAAPEVRSEPVGDGRRYQLILTYQLFNAPPALTTVTVPQQNLRLLTQQPMGEMQALTTLVPALRVTVAPLAPAVSVDRLNAASLQQDRPPLPLPVQARQDRFVWTAAALLALLLFAAWRRGLTAFVARKNLPFARAVRELRRLPPASGATAQSGTGLKIVHEAINRTAGRAVFAHNLDDFLAAHAEYAGLRDELYQLYAASGKVFFAHGAADAPPGGAPAALLRLCRLCRGIERRSFAARSPAERDAEKLHAAGN